MSRGLTMGQVVRLQPSRVAGCSPEDRRRLLALGYEPIPISGKAPRWSGWQTGEITPERLAEVEAEWRAHRNTGLRTGRLCVADVDLTDQDHVVAAVDALFEAMGETPHQRIGRKGSALLWHNPEPMGKVTVSARPPGSDRSVRLVEFLGTGQQVAAYGPHPDTREPYQWPNDYLDCEPLGTPLDNLPKTSPHQIREAAAAVAEAMEEFGYRDVDVSEAGVVRGEGRSSASGDPVTAAMLEAMLAFVDPGCDRMTWIKVAGAIHSARVVTPTGEDDEDHDPADLFVRWSAGQMGGDEPANHVGPEDCLKAFDSMRDKEGGSTVGSLVFVARRGGYVGPVVHRTGEDLFGDDVEAVDVVGGGDLATTGDLPEPDLARAKDGAGLPLKTYANALLAARHMAAAGHRPELDEFNHRVVFRGAIPWGERHGRVLDDDVLRAVRVHFLSRYDLDVAKDHVNEAVLTIAAANRFHPVREYLRRLTWDGTERLDVWLPVYCRAEDSPFVRAAGRKWLMAAVARAFRPATKFDCVLVLQGPQGCGKSSALRFLAGDDWFVDSLPGDLGKADAVQVLQGRWIVELSELEGLSRQEVTSVKAFLSRTSDRARFAYERHARDYPRQCVFAASTNEGAFLRDPTGGRRFWPVSVGTIDLDALRRDRDQLWAEAVAALRAGEGLELPRELWPDAARAQEARHAGDPWEESLRRHLDDGVTRTGVERGRIDRVHSADLLGDALGVPTERRTGNHSSRLRNIMESRLGWRYERCLKIAGRVSSGYVRPDAEGGE